MESSFLLVERDTGEHNLGDKVTVMGTQNQDDRGFRASPGHSRRWSLPPQVLLVDSGASGGITQVPIQDLNRETARGVSTCAMCWLGTQDPGAGFISWCHRVSHVLRQVPRPLSCRFFRGRVRASGPMRGFYSHARWDHLETCENQSTRCPGTWKA